jgi:hypothetical protein
MRLGAPLVVTYSAAMIRYRLEFAGPSELVWPPDHVFRDEPIVVGTVERYGGQRFLVEAVDESSRPPLALLRQLLD